MFTLLMHSTETADLSGWIAEALQGGAQGRKALIALVLLGIGFALKQALPFFRWRHKWATPWAMLGIALTGSAIVGIQRGLPWERVAGEAVSLAAMAVFGYEVGWKRVARWMRRWKEKRTARFNEGG